MDPASFTAMTLGLLLALVMLGVPIMVSLGLACLVGVITLTGNMNVALSLMATTGFEALRDYVFAVIPLFVLMGELMARSGCARDLYTLMDRVFRRLPGHLAVARETEADQLRRAQLADARGFAEVDDLEALVAEGDRAVEVLAVGVGTAMPEGAAHGAEFRFTNGRLDDAADAAHG